MTTVDGKKVAELLDDAATALSGLAQLFRVGGGSGGSAKADGKAAKPARGKPAASAEPEGDLDEDTVREALKELVELRGKEVMVQALQSVGAGKLADVDESQYQELMDKVNELKEEPEQAPAPAKGKAATKPTKGKAKGPSLDDVTTAAKALIEADKAAYLKITKKLGKPSEMDDSDYAAAIAAYEEAMPAAEGDDDLL